MSIPCPRCARPNHERMKSCLYCGQNLPEHEAPPDPRPPAGEAAGAETMPGAIPSEALRPRVESFHLFLEPAPDRPDLPDLARTLAPLLGLDAFGVRQRLASPAPRCIRRSARREDLEAVASALDEWSLRYSVLSSKEIQEGPAPFLARGFDPSRPGPRGLTFLGQEGTEAQVLFQDVDAIVTGQVNVRWTGKIAKPDPRKIVEDRAPSAEDLSTARSDYPLVDIHRPGEVPIVRLRIPDFDFSGLGPAKTPSSLINCKNLIDRFRAAKPSVAYSDAFKLHQQAIHDSQDDEGSYRSNEQQFDHFSRTFVLHKRRIAG